jgi:phosphinothricin acetyltransferase
VTEAPAILVREGEEPDLPALTAVYNHFVEHSVTTFDVERFTVDQRREWFGHYRPTGPHRLLVGEVDGVVAGYATSGPLRAKPAYAHSVETTIYCDPAMTGRGLGTTLYGRLLDLLATEDVHRAYAGVALPNEASERLHRRCGFHELGTYTEVGFKHGRWVDVRWYERAVPVASATPDR